MRVVCTRGYEGVLIEGEIYTVINVTKKGNYILNELDPPEPFTSFDKDRFEMVSDDDFLAQFDFIQEELETIVL